MKKAATCCRALSNRARFGTLATVAREPAGWPFASLVGVAFDTSGAPLLLLSALAEHTKNLAACNRASLLVAESAGADDALEKGRMTLVGACAQVVDSQATSARAIFLEAHPTAAAYASFGDFAMWRLDVASVRWVGGFGRMEWVTRHAYAGAARAS